MIQEPKGPEDHGYGWSEFEKWADDEDIGEHPEDWGIWWECWKGGCKFGLAAGYVIGKRS